VIAAYEDMPSMPPAGKAPGTKARTEPPWKADVAAPQQRAARAGVPPPPSFYAPSIAAGSLRRKLSQRPLMPSAGSFRGGSDYGSDEGPFELVKIRVKVRGLPGEFAQMADDAPQMHYQDDLRGMTLTPETPFDEFMDRVANKFGIPSSAFSIKFKDEDGSKVSLLDTSDYELAIETAREHANGRPEGKLEVWCFDG
jgi:hypothetical protein